MMYNILKFIDDASLILLYSGHKDKEWTPEAEDAVKKVPFFVKKRVKTRVEDEAHQVGKTTITLNEVQATQKRYLSGMAPEVKGQLNAGTFHIHCDRDPKKGQK
jgi:hypothetical protein